MVDKSVDMGGVTSLPSYHHVLTRLLYFFLLQSLQSYMQSGLEVRPDSADPCIEVFPFQEV